MTPPPPAQRFAEDRALQLITAGYAVTWILTAIAPHSREDWALENLVPLAFVALLSWSYPRFRFSTRSYLLMASFLGLHALGAHSTYAENALGSWVRESLGQERNHFDRAIHFSFGLLMSGPCREVVAGLAEPRQRWLRPVTVLVMVASSALYELLESWTARLVHPELGTAFLGTQGDPWDAQRDMTAALLGTLLWMLCVPAIRLRNPGS
jgi:putative membrane protein